MSSYSLIGCQDPNKDLCSRNWRSKPRISKVSNEDADLGITCAGDGAKLSVCSRSAPHDRGPKDSRLNQSGLSQKVVL